MPYNVRRRSIDLSILSEPGITSFRACTTAASEVGTCTGPLVRTGMAGVERTAETCPLCVCAPQEQKLLILPSRQDLADVAIMHRVCAGRSCYSTAYLLQCHIMPQMLNTWKLKVLARTAQEPATTAAIVFRTVGRCLLRFEVCKRSLAGQEEAASDVHVQGPSRFTTHNYRPAQGRSIAPWVTAAAALEVASKLTGMHCSKVIQKRQCGTT